MVKYCGYLVRNELLLQRAVDLGHPRPTAAKDQTGLILLGEESMGHTGVLRSAKLRRVRNPKRPYDDSHIALNLSNYRHEDFSITTSERH
jgi:hypothetical protein